MRKSRSFLTESESKEIETRIDLNESPIKIAKEIGVSYGTVWNHFKNKLKNRKIKNKNLKKIKILNSFAIHKELKAVQKETRSTWEEVRTALLESGIEPPTNTTNDHARKYWIDKDYFEVIDTEEKAYFLGLFYADGCVIMRQNENRKEGNLIYSASISLQKKDIDIMRAFSNAVYKADRLYKIVYKDGRGQDAYRLDMKCKKICFDLVALGCHPRKSLTLKFPTKEQVPSYLMNHFLRGYFDGDGSVGIYGKKKNCYTWSIISSNDFSSSWRDFFEPIVKKRGSVNERTSVKEGIKYLVVYYFGIVAFKAARDYFYKGATVFMKRKKDIFYSV